MSEREYPDTWDGGPHSRACGIRDHQHGPACHSNCPTCGGKRPTPALTVADGDGILAAEAEVERLRAERNEGCAWCGDASCTRTGREHFEPQP